MNHSPSGQVTPLTARKKEALLQQVASLCCNVMRVMKVSNILQYQSEMYHLGMEFNVRGQNRAVIKEVWCIQMQRSWSESGMTMPT